MSRPTTLNVCARLLVGLFALSSCAPSSRPLQAPQAPQAPQVSQAECEAKEKPAPAEVLPGKQANAQATWIAEHYRKEQHRIPMRDGIELFTTIYRPKVQSEPLPILLFRTPYSTGPYEADAMPRRLGPSPQIAQSRGYIFAYQDVRGTFMSQGEFENMRPQVVKQNPSSQDIDESTDSYDTIDWLVKNVPQNNGKVGTWGISYPGFYAAAGMINAHPALAAVSPQAPIADWFFDDFHHHGAFFLPHAFNFLSVFGQKRSGLTQNWPPRFDHRTPDGFAFFSRLGPLHNANDRYLKGKIAFWNDLVEHPNRDAFWQARDILPHLKNTAPAVMTVGGWFDAEDLYGPLKIYAHNEKNNPDSFNILVMGPWRHGGWARESGRTLGDIDFGANTSEFYLNQIEKPFFDYFLKGKGQMTLPEAYVFETGANRWRSFDQWPPPGQTQTLYFKAKGELAGAAPGKRSSFDSFISDPEKPVPFTQIISTGMPREYMTEDQRFAARRPDVLSYQTPVLQEDLTLAGELSVDLWVSTSQKDADWVVKLIDVLPATTPEHPDHPGVVYGEYQMMVRSEVFRGRFRQGYDKAVPFVPGRPTKVSFPLQDVLHRFKKGHRLMIQVQSTWFPLVDKNPQGWVDNIFKAKAADFKKAEHRLYHDAKRPSQIRFTRL